MDFLNSMNMGGGAASAGATKSTRLVDGLVENSKKLLQVWKEIADQSKRYADNVTQSGKNLTANGFTGGAVGGRTPNGFVDNAGGGMQLGTFSSAMKTAAVVGLSAATQALDMGQFAENALARSRVGFYSGQGSAAAAMSFQTMMNKGTGIDPLDAARAQLAGASQGLNPGLANYATVSAGAATFSNLVPGAGLTGGMQAMAALNQASNVNRLRMIGIQVRDPSTGLMRSPASIANDLWSKLNSQKSGTSPLTKQDIALSLQSGNALDMMINQYFGNDPVLRQGIVTELMQKASGGNSSKESLIRTGALPELAASTGERNAAAYGAINAYTGAAEQGMIDANTTIAGVANVFRDAAGVFSGAVQAFAFATQLAGGGNGALGTLGGGLISGVGSFLAGRAGAGGFGGAGGGGGVGILAAGKNLLRAGGPLLKGIGKAVPGVSGVLSGMDAFDNAQQGKGFDWGGALVNAGGAAAVGAASGLLTGGALSIPAALLAGGLSLGGSLIGHVAGGGSLFGEGDGSEDAQSSSSNPLSAMHVNAGYLQERANKIIDGKPTTNKVHKGVDLAGKTGDAVYAIKDGVIEVAKSNGTGTYGNYVKIRHADGRRSIYAHLSQVAVSSGQVKAGQRIGSVGETGQASGPHLHLEVWNGSSQDAHEDPLAYIGGASSAPSSTSSSVYGEKTTAASTNLLFDNSSGTALLPGFSGSAPGGIGDGSEGAAPAGGIRYGGVTVHINMPKGAAVNEQTLAKEIKRVLSDQDMLQKAVSR